MYEYVKLLLYVYPKLPEISEAVSVGAENGAILSFRAKGSALEAAEAVVSEMLLRNNLDRVRLALDEALALLSGEEKFLLEYKYFRRKRELGKHGALASCSERNYFRLQNALLKKLAALLAARGWTEEGCSEAFDGFSPFVRLKRALCEGREREFAAKRKKRQIEFKRRAAGSPQ